MIHKIKKAIKSNDRVFALLKQGLIYFRYLRSFVEMNKYDTIASYDVKRSIIVSENDRHCFFGYYDKSPLNRNSRFALFLRVAKKAKEGDIAEICIYDMDRKEKKVIGETRTWNWQQGAMEQWVDEQTLSFNSYDEKKNEHQTIKVNIDTGRKTITSRAAYFYNKDYTKYLSLNFYRLDLFAKGYGYPFQTDNMDEDEDGIWEIDVATNKSRLILSLKEVMDFEPKNYTHCQHYINHVAYCPDERYIIFIHRWQIKGGEFVSRLLKYDMVKHKLMALLDNGHVSHYCWKSDQELMIFATNDQKKKGYMVVDIETRECHLLEGLPKEDGHPTYSNDKKWVVTDTYPNNHRDQYLFLYRVDDKCLFRVDKLHSPFRYYNDFRCDLHPRWSSDNRYLIVDNTATGLRSLKIYKIKH